MTTPSFDARLQHLEAEVERLRAQARTTRRRVLGAAVALLSALSIGTAFAATGACPNGMPVCFQANQPAIASDVNLNFAQLKEWVEAKTGTVGANLAVSTPSSFSGGASFGSTVTVANTLTANGAASFNGSTSFTGGATFSGTPIESGFETSCVATAPSNMNPACCRLNKRTGLTNCRIATSVRSTAFGANTADPFPAEAGDHAYALTCFEGLPGQNFPTCCRTDTATGSVQCRAALNWQLSGWDAVGTAF